MIRRAPFDPAVVALSVVEQSVIRSPKFARLFCYARDRGECQDCHNSIDTMADASRLLQIERFIEERSKVKALVYRCPTLYGAWEVDHIDPLYAVDREAPGAYKFWLPGNLQTICRRCHKRKNRAENRDRRKVRAIVPTEGLTKAKLNKKDRYLARRDARPDWL